MEMHFDERRHGRKYTRDRTLTKISKSPGILVSASGASKTILLSSDPNDVCDKLKILLQQKHAGNNSNLIDEQTVAIIDKLLEY